MQNKVAKIVKEAEEKNNNRKVILASLVVGIVLMVLKFLAYYLTNSKAIFTDAVESIVNVVAAAFASYSVYLAGQPRDFNHPYGHGKIEYFSSGLEGLLILVAGFFTLIPALLSFISPQPFHLTNQGLLLVVISLVINLLVGLYLRYYGRKHHSMAIEADGLHLLTDAASSVFLLVGLLVIRYTNLPILDPVLGVILAALILFTGFKILRSAVPKLMDEMDEKLFEKAVTIANSNRQPQWIDIHNFRIQKHGAQTHIDCHLTLPYYMSLQQSHTEVSNFEGVFRKKFPKGVELFVHTDPCIPACCSYCQLLECPVRREAFTGLKEWTPELLFENKKHFEQD